jgi:S1-C subfamily serine protease
VIITKVLAGGAAAQAGLQVGDVIEELNGASVKSGLESDVAIAHYKPGSQIRLSYMRGAWKTEVTLTVGKIT